MVAAAFGLLAVAVAVGVGALLFPYVEDDWRLDNVVRVVALDWRDFGKDRARQRLLLEMTEGGIDTVVRPEDCRWSTTTAGRTLRCEWGVRIGLPGGGVWPLDFTSSADVSVDGDLR